MMDHSPFSDHERAALVRDIAAQLTSQPLPSSTPAQLAPALQRYIKFGGYFVCRECKMAQEWCACGKRVTDSPSGDARAESDLGKRIAECKGGR